MIDDEVVRRQGWMDREQLLDLIGVTNLLPGPNSTELAIHIGYQRAGWQGLLAGGSFILPAMTMVWILAALYARYQTVPQVGWLLYGIKPVIIAIILQALLKLGKKAIKDRPTTAVAIAVMAAYFLKVNEILLLVIAGWAVMLVKNLGRGGMAALWLPWSATLAPATAVAIPGVGPSGIQVFWFFLKVGSVLYGSGYVLLAFLQRDLVERLGWLTSQELLDAIAIGQFTPGPVFTTATFVGYLLAGHGGAIAGTLGIFLPAFAGGHRQPLDTQPASLPLVWGIFRRRQCRLPGVDGRRGLHPGAHGPGGRGDGGAGDRRGDRRPSLPPQFGMDSIGGGHGRVHHPASFVGHRPPGLLAYPGGWAGPGSSFRVQV
jgi:putative chromate ion transporter